MIGDHRQSRLVNRRAIRENSRSETRVTPSIRIGPALTRGELQQFIRRDSGKYPQNFPQPRRLAGTTAQRPRDNGAFDRKDGTIPQWLDGAEDGVWCRRGRPRPGCRASRCGAGRRRGCAGGAGTPDFTLYASITCLVMLVPLLAIEHRRLLLRNVENQREPLLLGVGLHHVVDLRSQRLCTDPAYPAGSRCADPRSRGPVASSSRRWSCCGWRVPRRSGWRPGSCNCLVRVSISSLRDLSDASWARTSSADRQNRAGPRWFGPRPPERR